MVREDHRAGHFANHVVDVKRDADGLHGRFDFGEGIGGETTLDIRMAVVGVQIGAEGHEAKRFEVVVAWETGPGRRRGGRNGKRIPITLELTQKALEIGDKYAYFLRE